VRIRIRAERARVIEIASRHLGELTNGVGDGMNDRRAPA
jgi:hypothetical protein